MMKTSLLLALALLQGDGRFLEVEKGARLRLDPVAGSRVLSVVDENMPLEVLERRDGWIRVRYVGIRGWLHSEGGDDAPTLPEGQDDRDSWLDDARCRLGARAVTLTGGVFAVETDLPDGSLRRQALAVVTNVEEAYRERLGFLDDPPDRPPASLLVFARSETYRALRDADPGLARVPVTGHARGNVAAVSGQGEPDDVLGVIVHEAAHLLNRRYLATTLPPWLEEGIAEDLAWLERDRDGRLRPGTRRPRVGLEQLMEVRRQGACPSLAGLLDFGPSDFVRGARRKATYPLSGLFVRFLLEKPRCDGFRRFLAHVARGGEATTPRLLEHLDLSLESESPPGRRIPGRRGLNEFAAPSALTGSLRDAELLERDFDRYVSLADPRMR